jgi:hypothetical protein
MTADDDRDSSTEPRGDPRTLPDEAVVIRGGISTPQTLHKTALAHRDGHADFAISCRSLPQMSADDLARVDPPLVRYPRLRETTVGVLRSAGYDVVRDEPPPAHALIMLPPLPADEDYLVISASFSEPRENPLYEKESP